MSTFKKCYLLSLLVVWVVCSYFVGREHGYKDGLHEAIDKGVGEWVIEYSEKDFSDVKRSFRWKTQP